MHGYAPVDALRLQQMLRQGNSDVDV
jgi:hypothetical protein